MPTSSRRVTGLAGGHRSPEVPELQRGAEGRRDFVLRNRQCLAQLFHAPALHVGPAPQAIAPTRVGDRSTETRLARERRLPAIGRSPGFGQGGQRYPPARQDRRRRCARPRPPAASPRHPPPTGWHGREFCGLAIEVDELDSIASADRRIVAPGLEQRVDARFVLKIGPLDDQREVKCRHAQPSPILLGPRMRAASDEPPQDCLAWLPVLRGVDQIDI